MTSINVFMFSCGQGDTILINARCEAPADEKWVLVDCNLGKADGTLDRFLDFVKRLGVRRLDLVVQTHADRDHFRGMARVLRYFQEECLGVGLYLDGGFEPKQARAILRDRNVARAYANLQDYVTVLAGAKTLTVMSVDVERGAFDLLDGAERVELVPLFPDSTHERCVKWRQMSRAGVNPNASLDSNALAIVMALGARVQDREFHALLASDADPQAVRDSLKYRARGGGGTLGVEFDLVKVPHHGAYSSHADELTQAGRNSDQVPIAAFSCGAGKLHPDRYVLRCFLDSKWKLLATTTRGTGRTPGARRWNHSVEVAGKSPRVPFQANDLTITWSPGRGMEAFPGDAQILAKDLHWYHTARKSS